MFTRNIPSKDRILFMSLISVKSQVKTECSLYLPWTAVDKEIYNDAKTTLWVSILAGVPIFKFEKYRSFLFVDEFRIGFHGESCRFAVLACGDCYSNFLLSAIDFG